MATRRPRPWCRRPPGGGSEWFIAAVGSGTLAIALILTLRPFLLPAPYTLVPITLLRNARLNGALCLDGSAPGYHYQKGSGSGSRNWVVHIEGGGWCNTVESCNKRKFTAVGSSRFMEHEVAFEGILSNEPFSNPDFYNWNRVKVRYCDAASFSGYVENTIQNGTTLFFRGRIIWEAIMKELLSIGLANARKALLTGCSAGGLATFLHCDDFHSLLPKTAIVKCFSDGGFFLDSKDISGERTIRSFYNDVVNLQGLGKILHRDCISSKEPSECLFPQNMVNDIKTPLFVLNSAYDWWQILHVLVPKKSDLSPEWQRCRRDIHSCDTKQLQILNGFRKELLNALSDFQNKKGSGMFINSCYIHCQTMSSNTWHSPHTPRINNKTIAEAFGDWYFNRAEVKFIDCPYPCNPTCYHKQFL